MDLIVELIREFKYDFENGMISKVWYDWHEGSFHKDLPDEKLLLECCKIQNYAASFLQTGEDVSCSVLINEHD